MVWSLPLVSGAFDSGETFYRLLCIPVLVPLTFIGGTAMCWLFSRERNIISLAVGQALLGALVWWAFPVAWHHGMRVGPGYYSFHP